MGSVAVQWKNGQMHEDVCTLGAYIMITLLIQTKCGKEVSDPDPEQVTSYLSCTTDSRVAVARDPRALCRSSYEH